MLIVNVCFYENLFGKTPSPLLCHLIKKKYYEELELLIELGADPNLIVKEEASKQDLLNIMQKFFPSSLAWYQTYGSAFLNENLNMNNCQGNHSQFSQKLGIPLWWIVPRSTDLIEFTHCHPRECGDLSILWHRIDGSLHSRG